jgi:hypothetical protein
MYAGDGGALAAERNYEMQWQSSRREITAAALDAEMDEFRHSPTTKPKPVAKLTAQTQTLVISLRPIEDIAKEQKLMLAAKQAVAKARELKLMAAAKLAVASARKVAKGKQDHVERCKQVDECSSSTSDWWSQLNDKLTTAVDECNSTHIEEAQLAKQDSVNDVILQQQRARAEAVALQQQRARAEAIALQQQHARAEAVALQQQHARAEAIALQQQHARAEAIALQQRAKEGVAMAKKEALVKKRDEARARLAARRITETAREEVQWNEQEREQEREQKREQEMGGKSRSPSLLARLGVRGEGAGYAFKDEMGEYWQREGREQEEQEQEGRWGRNAKRRRVDGEDRGADFDEAMEDSEEDMRANFKKSMCKFFLEGRCRNGDGCTYAHDESELQRGRGGEGGGGGDFGKGGFDRDGNGGHKDEGGDARRAAAAGVTGYVFMSSSATCAECVELSLLGCPASALRSMQQQIHQSTKLFLLDFDSKTMHGVFTAVGKPRMNIVPGAWATSGRGRSFPAQLRVRRLADEECSVGVEPRQCKRGGIYQSGPYSAEKTSALLDKLGYFDGALEPCYGDQVHEGAQGGRRWQGQRAARRSC